LLGPSGERGRTSWSPAGGETLPAALRLHDLRIRSDEAYLYLRLDVGAIDWKRGRWVIGIDTQDRSLGARRLPRTGLRCDVGLEFALDLVGPEGSQLLVDREYDLYRTVALRGSEPPLTTQVYNRPWRRTRHLEPRWDTLRVETNRTRVGRGGAVYPGISYQRNRLLHARQSETTLADWYADPASRTIEVRLPWGMLHVLDPSSRMVLGGMDRGGGPKAVPTDGFRFVVASYDPARTGAPGTVVGCGRGGDPIPFTWDTWETPSWHQERKPLFEAMREAFDALEPRRSTAGDRSRE